MIKVLVVEDSLVVRELLVHILSSDSEIQVIGTARNGVEALEFIKRNKPDIITMDINMPKMNGFEATSIIMQTSPIPIVIVTGSFNIRDAETTFRAMESGALTVVQQPRGIGHPDHELSAKELIRTLKLMSEVKLVRRLTLSAPKVAVQPPVATGQLAEIKVVAIGASTGGPPVIGTILSGLPNNFPVPVLIVQHMALGFIQGFVEWLNQASSLPVHVATNGSDIFPGHVYVAPDGVQMAVQVNSKLSCINDDSENGLRPSVSYLFRSVRKAFGRNAVAILLTGMGKDGAEELKLLKEKGAVTIVQDLESSIVFGMPGEAIKLDAATYVLAPGEIVAVLTSLLKKA